MLSLRWMPWSLLAVSLAAHGASQPPPEARLNAVQSVEHAKVHDGRIAIRLGLKQPLARAPSGFRTFHPMARIVLELPDTTVAIPQKTIQVDRGVLRSMQLVQVGAHTRFVINLVRPVTYETAAEGSALIIVLGQPWAGAAGRRIERFAQSRGAPPHQIREVAFRRSAMREATIVVSLSDSMAPIDVREEGRQLIVNFRDTGLAPGKQQRLDVLDFATPVGAISTYETGNNARMVVEPVGAYELNAYQSGSQFVVAVRPAAQETAPSARRWR